MGCVLSERNAQNQEIKQHGEAALTVFFPFRRLCGRICGTQRNRSQRRDGNGQRSP